MQDGLITPAVKIKKRSSEHDNINNHIKKKRPIDRNMPPKVETPIPESKLYTELCEFEKNLDVAIMRKRLDIQEAFGKPPHVRRTMRIFISNSAADQPNQTDDGTNFELNDDNDPSWTLRVEGRLLDPLIPTKKAQPIQKFTSFFKSIIVELDRDQDQYPEGNLIEWRKQASSVDTDGIEIKRKGDSSVNARIILVPDFTPQKYKVSHGLSEIIGFKLATPSSVIDELWKYIKLHKLHDHQDKRIIHLDQRLTELFKTEDSQIDFTQLPQLIQHQLSAPDPIVIDYTIRVDKQFHRSNTAYDIDVELDNVARQRMMNAVAATQLQKDVMALDDKIVQCVQSINNSKIKRDFLTQFCVSPIEFINKWITSQARDLEIILGETKVNMEDIRQSDFYKQPWVKEAVFHYLTSKTQQRMQELLATQN
ncbi:SWI/SNF-related matrix-associated actin-dependent regulator of chromatin subfamily D member 1 [Choanephora cucurbitarum]|uniref:SWI/SNF-related matrix-associated actin-dependent regulator of chromatin subfamily D member 1 n=1 Tax=Choanephora cucurbitarum TaxID=101091 RepID=A0A1C7NAG1_9FUNG|nr:SWI/SNF-related matrix-associated actin-dependent regulator of chromatin subfamily D member 1 [Choanephora cucurbitarum]